MPDFVRRDVRQCPLGQGPEQRLADMAMRWWRGRRLDVAAWLRQLGCTVEEVPGELALLVTGLTGIRGGLLPGGDPIQVAVQLGLFVVGPFWPQVFPGTLKRVNQRWKEQRRQERVSAGTE